MVYVSEKPKGTRRYPYFAHRQGEGLGCPWHPASKLSSDEARAAQYKGNQVSAAHEFLCAELARLVRLDARFQAVEIDKTYIAGDDGQGGRYPDVRFRWEGLPECVCEVQLSNTFQPEISQRGIFYEGKGMPLVWILHGVEPRLENLPSSFRDVILRHKNNAFALDQEAVAASEREKTLVLKCFLLNAGAVVETHLVRFDALTFPKRGLPYFRNMLLPDMAAFRARRRPWIEALKALKAETDGNWYASHMGLPEVVEAFNTLPAAPQDPEARYDFARLVAITMTLLSEAGGRYQDLVYRHMPNATAALNTFLSRGGPQQRCAEVLRVLVDRTALVSILRPTVREAIGKAIAMEPDEQVRPHHPFYDGLSWLVPEVFDEAVREELEQSEALPGWASPLPRAVSTEVALQPA
ncbi:hypothetical protein EJ074_11810 [Mesorhizobium sp. M3A.F.Ca.ET.080.04.2.1]|uniref:hypothetical protein n=1 Tax=Mesorhizobium sp. M3A.F.Ca.ET.080.04.2.1 TaxID=2493676 RepID=UPI000F75FA05|nr:hypothetical protein [Mesorhizobium sp. M3A.F.Ca.ET.080.04.2.1]AZO09710.1 hypothetical protein EJ074_11810 [Mesorhizobium sp. M3A.F.Ca.ET.080.04.2.1]RWF24299.1 MAG: hypothetical protein EOS64_08190 [Mesorhizobium sp.]TGT57714.1 hypothetical protein EN813_037465 [Mesorhizobium sp. M00.F.Ca.ET.170.01.1.1]